MIIPIVINKTNVIAIDILNETINLFIYHTDKGKNTRPIKKEKTIFSSGSRLKLFNITYIGTINNKTIPPTVITPVIPNNKKIAKNIIINIVISIFLSFKFILTNLIHPYIIFIINRRAISRHVIFPLLQ